MIVAIVFLLIVGTVFILHQIKLFLRQGSENTSEEFKAEMESLEARVRVLERLATDRQQNLKDEIDKLND